MFRPPSRAIRRDAELNPPEAGATSTAQPEFPFSAFPQIVPAFVDPANRLRGFPRYMAIAEHHVGLLRMAEVAVGMERVCIPVVKFIQQPIPDRSREHETREA
jgi:hypothetical protein